MSLFGTTKTHDEADIRVLLCVRWTNLGRRFSEEGIKNKLGQLYPSRTFDVKRDITQAVAKGFIGTGGSPEKGGPDGFFITERGWKLVLPKWNGVKIKKEEIKK